MCIRDRDYRTGLLSSDIIKTLRPWGLKVIADSANPRLIQEIHNGGIKIYAVETVSYTHLRYPRDFRVWTYVRH